MTLLRPRFGGIALLLALAGPVQAQLPPLTVPGGKVRFEVGGRFTWWDEAFIRGIRSEAIAGFLHNPVTSAILPGLGASEAALRAVTGASLLTLSPGATTGALAVNVGAAEIGAALGITSRITVFGTVPIVRVRVQPQLLIDSAGATAGFNPADPLFGTTTGAAATNSFLSELSSALTSLSAAIQAGRYTGDPDRLAEAQATLARGTTLRSGLETLLLGSPFLPIAGSPGALALQRTIDSLRVRLTTLDADSTGMPVLTGSPALPESGLPPEGLEAFATSSGGPIQATPFEPEIYRAIGDVEVGAAVALLTGQPPSRGIAVRSVLRGTVRLPTAQLPDPNSLFEVGTGERHLAIRTDLVTDVMTSRFGARFSAAFTVQRPARFERRVTPPDQPFAPATSLALVEREPGSILEGSIQPYVRIARHFSVVAGVSHWRKRSDRFTYAPGQTPLPGVDASVLGQDSRENATVVSAGFSFSHDGLRQDGRVGLPLDATVSGQMVAGSTEGRVPARRGVIFQMRVYGKLF